MREIKFRAWDGKTMTYPRTIEIGVNGWNGLTSASYQLDSGGYCTSAYVMQFTGLKDSKGREIYEGDILRYTRFGWRCYGHPQDNTDLVTYYKVIWDEAECAFKVDNKNMTGSLCFDDSRAKKNEIELIGNIYENPKLLEGD